MGQNCRLPVHLDRAKKGAFVMRTAVIKCLHHEFISFYFTRSSVQLSRGIHTLQLRIRSTGPFTVACSIKLLETKQTFQVSSPAFLPHLVNGWLLSNFIPIPITNLHGSHWLKVTKVSLVKEASSSSQFTVKMTAEDKAFTIAPGQVRPIRVVLEQKNRVELEHEGNTCADVKMVLKISTNQGQDQKLAIMLRCRRISESFLFTFLDHDGSVQHAAAIAPLKGCASGICPVLLTLHGTSRYKCTTLYTQSNLCGCLWEVVSSKRFDHGGSSVLRMIEYGVCAYCYLLNALFIIMLLQN